MRVYILRTFFQDTKSSTAKHQKYYWKRLMEPVKLLSWIFLQKELTVYSQKEFHLTYLKMS